MEQNKSGYMRNLVELKVNFELFLLLLGFAAFPQIPQLHTVISSVSPESARKRTWSRRNALDFQKKKPLSVTLHIGNPTKVWLELAFPFPAKISQTGWMNIRGFVPEIVLRVFPKAKWLDHLGNTRRIFSFSGASLFLAESWSLGRTAKNSQKWKFWIISWDPGNTGSLPCSGTKVLSSSKLWFFF